MNETRDRAERWLTQTRERLQTIEPEWWLRMECGQVGDEDEARRGFTSGGHE